MTWLNYHITVPLEFCLITPLSSPTSLLSSQMLYVAPVTLQERIISFLQHPETAAPSYPRSRGEGGHSSGIRGGKVAAGGGFCCGMLPRLAKVNRSLAAYPSISHLLICVACQPFLLVCKSRGYSPLNRGLWSLTLLWGGRLAKVRAGRFPAFWKDQSPCFLSLSGSIEQGVSSTQSLPTFEKGNIKAWERPCDFYKVSQEFSGKVMVRISMF